MTYEPYDPNDRQITPRTQAVAWLVLLALLIGTVAVSDALTGRGRYRARCRRRRGGCRGVLIATAMA